MNSLKAIVEQLESCGYECFAGPLENNIAFVALKQMAEKSLDIFPINPEELNRELIDKLALDNPVIRNALTIHVKGNYTYEQALIAMVIWLASHNAELVRLQIERLNVQRIPFILKGSE